MEQKSKSLATGSCEGEGPCTVDMVDRINNLPKGVIHRIFSRFDIKDLAQFCCVSKRWRKLCLSSPTVIFRFDPLDMECQLKLRLMNALDRFLLFREGNEMKRFCLFWTGHPYYEVEDGCFCINESFRIITWIQNAVRCKAEKVIVEVTFFPDHDEEPLEFPSCVLRSASLRSLVVQMPRTVVKTPSFSFFSNIEKLKLGDVVIQEGFFKWISYCCKSLKDISLYELREVYGITIERSSLEKFNFCDFEVTPTCHINISSENLEKVDVFCAGWRVIIKVVAPNVKHWRLWGNVIKRSNLGELECLEEALIVMEPAEDGIKKAYEVALNEATIKAAYREEHTQAQLEKIWYLQMNIGTFTDDLVPAVVCLLRRTPELCDLYICYKPTTLDPKHNASGFAMEYWKIQSLEFVSQVEDVTIELSAGSNGTELARYILEHARYLEKMVIRHVADQSNVIEKLKESKVISKRRRFLLTLEEYEPEPV